MKSDEKLCPFCAETIKKEAIRCKHCSSDVVDIRPNQLKASNPTRRKYTTFWVLIIFLAILAATNPSENDFKYEVVKNIQGSGKVDPNDIIGKLTTGITSYAINAITERKNYLFFSIFEIDNSLLKIIDPNTHEVKYLGILGMIIPLNGN